MKDLGIEWLSHQQRIALALEIWESLGNNRPPARLTTEQRAKLARRDAELDTNPGVALTWEQTTRLDDVAQRHGAEAAARGG